MTRLSSLLDRRPDDQDVVFRANPAECAGSGSRACPAPGPIGRGRAPVGVRAAAGSCVDWDTSDSSAASTFPSRRSTHVRVHLLDSLRLHLRLRLGLGLRPPGSEPAPGRWASWRGPPGRHGWTFPSTSPRGGAGKRDHPSSPSSPFPPVRNPRVVGRGAARGSPLPPPPSSSWPPPRTISSAQGRPGWSFRAAVAPDRSHREAWHSLEESPSPLPSPSPSPLPSPWPWPAPPERSSEPRGKGGPRLARRRSLPPPPRRSPGPCGSSGSARPQGEGEGERRDRVRGLLPPAGASRAPLRGSGQAWGRRSTCGCEYSGSRWR